MHFVHLASTLTHIDEHTTHLAWLQTTLNSSHRLNTYSQTTSVHRHPQPSKMATAHSPTNASSSLQQQSTEFEARRAALVAQIGDSLEQVLTQINGLNRGLEGIIEIGNEFASVEALWSQFEGVMGHGSSDQQQQQQQQRAHSVNGAGGADDGRRRQADEGEETQVRDGS